MSYINNKRCTFNLCMCNPNIPMLSLINGGKGLSQFYCCDFTMPVLVATMWIAVQPVRQECGQLHGHVGGYQAAGRERAHWSKVRISPMCRCVDWAQSTDRVRLGGQRLTMICSGGQGLCRFRPQTISICAIGRSWILQITIFLLKMEWVYTFPTST